MITTSSFLAMVAAPIVAGGLIAALKHAFVRDDLNVQFPDETVVVLQAPSLRVCN